MGARRSAVSSVLEVQQHHSTYLDVRTMPERERKLSAWYLPVATMHITFVTQKVPLYSLHGTYLHCSKQISWHRNFTFVRSWRLKSCSLKNTIEFQGSRDNIFCSAWVKCHRKTIAFLSSSTLTYIMSELNVCYEAKRLCNLNRKHIF